MRVTGSWLFRPRAVSGGGRSVVGMTRLMMCLAAVFVTACVDRATNPCPREGFRTVTKTDTANGFVITIVAKVPVCDTLVDQVTIR